MWCEERIVGLTLIHGNNQPDTKPRVFVVAENSVHAALSSDLELDVYPECFDYDSFVKASLSKSISTNGAIVLVSDALSQRVAPLEAVIALVRSNVILIPWKSSKPKSHNSMLRHALLDLRPTLCDELFFNMLACMICLHVLMVTNTSTNHPTRTL